MSNFEHLLIHGVGWFGLFMLTLIAIEWTLNKIRKISRCEKMFIEYLINRKEFLKWREGKA